MFRALASLRTPVLGWDWSSAEATAAKRFFPYAAESYDERASGVAQVVDDINASATVELVRGIAPDVVVCLGGPIYRAPLIDACRMMLNFHSGISPLYNGTSTILFAFANGHIHLCGGTLMIMSLAVDGGDVLGHYLPAIENGDDPATLFMKTVRGAAVAYDRVLTYLEDGGTLAACPQPPALFYYTGADWTVEQTHRIKRLLESRAVERFTRDDEHIDYYPLAGADEARLALRGTIERLLEL
jgi:methionyl-tRNA formyltransferase